jgi:iron-sulfur cluster assembly accessory protein
MIDREETAPTWTPAAEAFVRRMLRFGGQGPGAGFRLQVSPGGCSGMASSFSVEAKPEAEDRVLDVRGLTVFVPPASYRLLHGVTIDFVETPTQSGFAFIDPTAGPCGCSSSAPGAGRTGA